MKSKQKMPTIEVTEEIQKLSTELGISVQKIFDVFDKDKDNILTVIDPVGKSVKDKIQNITLLTLFGYKLFFGLDEVLSQEIRRNVVVNKISPNNLGLHLGDLSPKFVRRKGKLRSPKTSYRLTRFGEGWVKELFRKIVGGSATESNHNETNASSIETLLDNESLWSACKSAFENKEYWKACLHALIHLETKIREKSGLASGDIGTSLVTKAFHPKQGILRIPSCEVENEEKGFHLINMGIVMFHRNAKGHREGEIGRKDATKIICYVDYLLEMLKTAEKRD